VTAVAYRQAVNAALRDEMEADARVVLLGEDVTQGGVFNVTPDLVDGFGPKRVVDTPISKLAFTSAAFGAAVRGLRPVVEIMFGDFLGLVLDTLGNQASKYWYLSNEQSSVPLTVRSAVGAGASFGACHSQTPTGWFMGEPGLKLVAPSTPADAYALRRAAIQDPNPVVVFEHEALYARKGELDGQGQSTQLGRAAVRRSGADVTIVAALAMVERALEAADALADDGIEAEVIDLRSLRPLDREAIGESVTHTRRLVAVEEGPPQGGYAAEVIALALEEAGPIAARRVTMPDLPIPFAPTLENVALPDSDDVAAAARALVGG
jgi:acetoin:2,6-dichlorophenolindophenol oxidoreductase subunit beta